VIALCFVLVGFPDPFRWLYLVLLGLNAAIFSALLVKWFRDLKRS